MEALIGWAMGKSRLRIGFVHQRADADLCND